MQGVARSATETLGLRKLHLDERLPYENGANGNASSVRNQRDARAPARKQIAFARKALKAAPIDGRQALER
jgi:hypothetical protein